MIYSQCTTSGGGGAGYMIFYAFESLGIISELYLITRCSLHNLHTVVQNGAQLVLDEDGLDNNHKGKLNTIQLSHGVYNIKIARTRQD